MLNCAGYFTRPTRSLGSGSVSTVVHRSWLSLRQVPVHRSSTQRSRTRLRASSSSHGVALFTFSRRVSLAPSAKPTLKRFAGASIVTPRPQQRVLIREMYSLSPGNVILSSRSIYARRDRLRKAATSLASRRDRFTSPPVTCVSDLLPRRKTMRVHFRCGTTNKMKEREKKSVMVTAGLRRTQARNTIEPVRLYDRILPSA